MMEFKENDKVKVTIKANERGRRETIKGTILKVYEHFYLVQHRFFKESYCKSDLTTKEVIFELN